MGERSLRRWAVLLLVLMLGLSGCSDSDGRVTRRAGTQMKVDASNGTLRIKRPKLRNKKLMGKKGTWTILVYMCGSDLESRLFFGGAASADIEQMCKATASRNVRFVIETGGCSAWENEKIDNEKIGRFVVEKGRLKKVQDTAPADMGKSKTLKSFLAWGAKKYPAEKMGLIFWNHGGGSISGACFDELNNDDALTLREMDAALLNVTQNGPMTDTFEFIGFDACLMGSIETANIAASYADYLIASPEMEPGTGWDYKAIGSYLAAHPGAGGAELGKAVCDSFKKECQKIDDDKVMTMSVLDLRKLDQFMTVFNRFAEQMYKKSGKKDTLTEMVRKIVGVERFGPNNKAEGYTNMIDLGGMISSGARWTDEAKKAKSALEDVVVYRISGPDHKNASGMSIYYPLALGSSEEMDVFESVCVSPYYLSFVGRQGYGSVNEGDTSDYDDDELFEDGTWSWLDEFLYDEESGDYDYDYEESDDNWDFFDNHEGGESSELISFEEGPGIDDEGHYAFVLDDEGYENTSEVLALVYQNIADDQRIELGETYDVDVDWDTGYVRDNFDGYWLSLPDGQNLALYIVDVKDDYVIYTSPILYNGEEAYLRMRQYFDDTSVKVDGVWDGIYESGACDKEIVPLSKGDEITPTYFCVDNNGEDLDGYRGDAVKIGKSGLKIKYDLMMAGDYDYAFCVTDTYGDDYITEPAVFNIDDNGEIWFIE